MTQVQLHSEFVGREQGYSDHPISRMELPFPLKGLPRKRITLCSLGYEFIGCHIEASLDLAPPVRGRNWWSIWSSVREQQYACGGMPTHRYARVPIAFIRAFDEDMTGDVAKYLLIGCMDHCCMGCEEIGACTLSANEVRVAQFALGRDLPTASSAHPKLNHKDREEILRHAFPDLRNVISKRLDECLNV
jgi:hypothetical protein